jgi:MarR family transcriptional regulator, organic hydroperoxide resistance regulator
VYDASSATDINENQPDRWAECVLGELRRVNRLLRQSFQVDLARANLTAPQVALLTELSAEDGQALADLSKRLHLSHSTVSGIVDRLIRKGLVERRTDPRDRRYSRIFVSEPVATYLRRTVSGRQRGPLDRAAERASDSDRAAICAGLRLLRQLLDDDLTKHGPTSSVPSGE